MTMTPQEYKLQDYPKCSFSGEVDDLFEFLSEHVELHGYGDAPRWLEFANLKSDSLVCELISEDDHDDVLRVRLRGTIRTDVLFISHIDIVEVRG